MGLALLSSASTSAVMGATKSDVFIALVTAEGLLFAALAVSASIAGSEGTFGPKTLGKPWMLAAVATVLLLVVAVGAVLAWADLFTGSNWSTSSDRIGEAIALLVAIAAQPVVALIIAIGIAS